ncbi:DUF6077 domain-containing protein [Xanthomonas translucens]|nr:DUF6077 domain-containing protein [Xanthomonas translucens]WLA08201.1 DUF6077 domain-containing protein [Xanthomonas translucens]
MHKSHEILAACLASFAIFLATSVASLMFAQRLSLRFSVVAVLIGGLAVATLSATAMQVIGGYRRLRQRGQRLHLAGAIALALAGGWLAMSINRPDIDDSIYVPKAVYYVEHPDAPIDTSVNWLAGLERTPNSGVFPYYELTQAALSWLGGVPYLAVYHVLFPGIVGFLMCAAAIVLIGAFETRPRTILLCGVFYLLLLLALGETHRAYGNLSIARAFHGKYMFLSVGVPAWIYFSLRYLRQPQPCSWLILTAVGVGMAAATPTAMVFLPFLALTLALAVHVQESRAFASTAAWLAALRYGACLAPVVLMAIAFRFYAVDNIAARSQINAGFPTSFADQLRLIVNPDYPLTPVLFVASLALVLAFSPYRRFFATWVATLCVLLLNPWVSHLVMLHLTTENIYWRMFYLLPFPLLAALALAPLANAGRRGPIWAGLCLVAAGIAATIGPTSVLRHDNGATLALPGYKIGTADRICAQQLVQGAAPGSMLAPVEIASNVLLLSSRFPQYVVREDYLGLMMSSVPARISFQQRQDTAAYLYRNAATPEAENAFRATIAAANGPAHVLVRTDADRHAVIAAQLGAAGYRRAFAVAGGYELFSRTPRPHP